MNNLVECDENYNEELKDYFMIHMFDKIYNCLNDIKDEYKIYGFGNLIQFLKFIEVIINSLQFYKVNDNDDELSDYSDDENIYFRKNYFN
jgi:hypothetical protein